jgi:prepilin-type processing-associated H-X9-DG protein
LPYLEEKSLYRDLSPNHRRLVDLLGSRDKDVARTPLSVFRCPSDGSTTLLTGTAQRRDMDGEANVGNNFFASKSNYVGVTGFWDIGVRPENGVFFANSATRFSDIHDGATNTFAIGERDSYCAAGTWVGVPDGRARGPKGADYVLGRVSIKMNAVQNTGAPSCCQAFSSPHPDGANFALCGGSVQFVGESIRFNNAGVTKFGPGHPPIGRLDLLGIYQRLGIRNDRQATGAPF